MGAKSFFEGKGTGSQEKFEEGIHVEFFFHGTISAVFWEILK